MCNPNRAADTLFAVNVAATSTRADTFGYADLIIDGFDFRPGIEYDLSPCGGAAPIAPPTGSITGSN